MTAEEAIKRIQDHMDVHRIGEYPHIKLSKALNMAISALRDQEERSWIPVTEKLPDVGIEVLIYSEDDGVCVDYYVGDSFGYYDVTHWMPLPEPPKEDDNAKMQ